MIGDYKLHRACVFSHAAIRLIERKERFYVRKRFNSHRIGLEHQNGYLFLKQLLFRNPKVAEMTSCENALLAIFSMRGRLDRCSVELHDRNHCKEEIMIQFPMQPCDYQKKYLERDYFPKTVTNGNMFITTVDST